MKRLAALAISVSVVMAQGDRAALHSVNAVRHWSLPDVTRVAIEVSGDFKFRTDRLHSPERIYFDILNARPQFQNRRIYSETIDDKLVQRVRVAETVPGVTRVVLDLAGNVEISTSQLTAPHRLMIELRAGAAPTIPTVSPAPAPKLPSPPAGLTDPLAAPKPPPVLRGDAAPSAALITAEPSKSQTAPAPVPAETGASPESPKASGRNAAAAAAAEAIRSQARNMPPASSAGKPDAAANPAETGKSAVNAVPPAGKSEGTANPAETTKSAAKSTPPPAPAAKSEAPPTRETAKSAAKTTAPVSSPAFPMEIPSIASPAPAEPASRTSGLPAKIPAPKVEIAEKTAPAPPLVAELGKAARHTSTGDTSLVRALGLKVGRVVIDPGHGGHDQGTEGPHGLLEKELVLDVGKRVGKLIEDRMGAEVIYTRSDDTFIPLEGRTALANERKADLFLSIHANSSPVPRIAGVETYYLNFNPSKEAMDVAARENATSQRSIFDLQDLVQTITLHNKAEESREFAARLQTALFAFSARNFPTEKNRGVKKAPFVVLIGATMPSVLAEIGFLSNTREEALLKKSDYRQKLAEALYRGISRYAETLSHFQLAKNQP